MPTGTCQCMMLKTAPAGWMVMDNSQVDYEDAPDLVELLWQFDLTKGDSSTYAVLPNMNGRVFQGTTTVADVCKYLEAQLPNITGRITSIRSWSSSVQCVGAFSGSYIRDNVLNSVSGSGDDAFDLALKASDDNATYSGTGLQPSAIQCMPCIRC